MSNIHKSSCGMCGEQLTPEEITEPTLDDDGDIMCFRCELEHNYEECDICADSVPKEQFGKFIAVFDVDKAFRNEEGKKRGFYRVKQNPYYISNYFSAWLLEYNIEYVKPLPKDADGEGYGCGDVCDDCIQKYKLA